MSTLLQQLDMYYKKNNLDENRIIIYGENNQLSFAQLKEKVLSLSAYLQQQSIKTLAVYSNNCAQWMIIDLACQEADVCSLPLPLFFSNQQLSHCLEESAADALITQSNTIAFINTTIETSVTEPNTGFYLHLLSPQKNSAIPTNTSKITFTSGSTGKPKGVCLDNDIQLTVANALNTAITLKNQKHLCLLPLSTLLENIGGAYRALLSGGSIVLFSEQHLGFNGTSFNISQLLNCIEKNAINTLILLPELLIALVEACKKGWQIPASLSFIAVGGAKVSPSLINTAHHYGLPVFQGYGLSECGSVVSLNTPHQNNVSTCGKALNHNQTSIHNNELVVTGKVFLGYLNEPESWYKNSVKTGDLAQIDNKSFITIKGRRKNLLISSLGRNINPEWIESEILTNSIIQQCVVVGDSQPYCCALITSRHKETKNTDIDKWLDQCNSQLPEYARIKSWLRLPEPMTSAQGLWTENGRPKRQAINHYFKSDIEKFYLTASFNSIKVASL
jgi:long-subunit acyl-CoA synthetase (AMP-forming)